MNAIKAPCLVIRYTTDEALLLMHYGLGRVGLGRHTPLTARYESSPTVRSVMSWFVMAWELMSSLFIRGHHCSGSAQALHLTEAHEILTKSGAAVLLFCWVAKGANGCTNLFSQDIHRQDKGWWQSKGMMKWQVHKRIVPFFFRRAHSKACCNVNSPSPIVHTQPLAEFQMC